MENFTPYSAAAGGALIGLGAALLLFFNGRIAGISGIINGSLTQPKGDTLWRILFIAGLVLGAGAVVWTTPLAFIPRTGFSPILVIAAGLLVAQIPALIISVGAGLLVGFGTRMGSGCTSGHGVCGLARMSPRSLIATLTFVATGAVTVFIVRQVVGG